jgi:hypothetical protein
MAIQKLNQSEQKDIQKIGVELDNLSQVLSAIDKDIQRKISERLIQLRNEPDEKYRALVFKLSNILIQEIDFKDSHITIQNFICGGLWDDKTLPYGSYDFSREPEIGYGPTPMKFPEANVQITVHKTVGQDKHYATFEPCTPDVE